MNKQIEALKMAIEAMECVEREYGWEDLLLPVDFNKSLQACKEALAEAEQKEKQEEAFAELVKLNQEMGGYDMQPIKPLVTAPSITISNTTTIPATWKSLSDDEIDNIWTMNFEFGFRACARAIEQASKEKNHV